MSQHPTHAGSKLSVCIVAPAMPPVIGGAETFAELLSLSLSRADLEVHVLTAEKPRPEVVAELQRRGGSVEIHGSAFGARDGFVAWEWATFSRAEAIHRLVTTREIDVVHALSHDTMIAACVALAGHAPSERPPVVATTSEMSTEEHAFGIARSRFSYQLAIDGLFQLSEYYHDVAMKHGCAPRATRVAAAVDTDLFSNGSAPAGREFLGVAKDSFLLTCPSRFSRRKGQHDLLAALDLLPSELQRQTVCLLAGSASSASQDFMEQLQAGAQSSPVRCLVTGVPRQRMPDVFAASDLVVMPSYKEGLGFAAIESMVAGCPVLLNEVTGFNEIPSGPGQVAFTPAGDVPALADRLTTLMTDRDERAALAAAGQAHALRRFTPTALSGAAISLYRELVEPARMASPAFVGS